MHADMNNLICFRPMDSIPRDLSARLLASFENPDIAVSSIQPQSGSPVGAVRNLLALRPEEHLPLDELARYAGYSPWHFLRLFRKATGLAPHAFQLLCRLSLVRELLRTDPPAEAAASAGFTDQSHMHKLFKLHHGLTPRQFAGASFTLEY